MSKSFAVVGVITFETVVDLLGRVEKELAAGTETIDLSLVTTVDSSCLAFWLAIERKARDLGKPKLRWVGLPEQMLSIAKLVGMEEMVSS